MVSIGFITLFGIFAIEIIIKNNPHCNPVRFLQSITHLVGDIFHLVWSQLFNPFFKLRTAIHKVFFLNELNWKRLRIFWYLLNKAGA